MRILVTSDTHGRADLLAAAIRAEGNFSMLIHLGDGAADVDADAVRSLLDGRPVLQVCGNCDPGAFSMQEQIVTQEGGQTLFCTHGHLYSVEYGEQRLIEKARAVHADIALYGHTHVPVHRYEDGLYVCNPGSLHSGQYAVLEIVPQGVMWLPKKINLFAF